MTETSTVMPNFLVVGAMKCATTSLCAALAQRMDVFICEPNFFCRDNHYDKGLAHYARLFENAEKETAIGEGSTSYTKSLIFLSLIHI